MDFTSLLQLKLPTRGGTPPLGPEQLRDAITTNAQKLDRSVLYSQGTSMPSSAPLGAMHYREDTGDVWVGTGSSWRFDRATAITRSTANTYASGAFTPFGALTHIGPALFTRAAAVGAPGNSLLRADVAGVYDFSAVYISGSSTAPADLYACLFPTETGIIRLLLDRDSDGGDRHSLRATFPLEAGQGFEIAPAGGAAGGTISHAVVRRVCPL